MSVPKPPTTGWMVHHGSAETLTTGLMGACQCRNPDHWVDGSMSVPKPRLLGGWYTVSVPKS